VAVAVEGATTAGNARRLVVARTRLEGHDAVGDDHVFVAAVRELPACALDAHEGRVDAVAALEELEVQVCELRLGQRAVVDAPCASACR
jgi:hypothetical protein